MSNRRSITADYLRKVLTYSKETGVFRWKEKTSLRIVIGEVAGSVNREGYRKIQLRGNKYSASRLAYLHMTGNWPSGEVDHINHDKDDNRWSNLRDIPSHLNKLNKPLYAKNKTGVPGVIKERTCNRWKVTIKHDGNAVYIGLFETFFDAVAARKSAENLYGFHVNHGAST